MRNIVSPLSGFLSPFGKLGPIAAWTIDGISPKMVDAFDESYYFNDGKQNKFATHNIGAATTNRTATLSNGLLGWAGHNLLTFSEDWVGNYDQFGTGGTTVSTTLNGLPAFRIEATADREYYATTFADQEAGEYTLRAFIEVHATTGSFLVGLNDNVNARIEGDDITDGVGEVTFTHAGGAMGSFRVGIGPDGSSTGDITVTALHLYRSDLAGMQTNDTPFPTYYPTTSAAYYAPAFDHDPVTLAAKGMRVEPAATNLLLNSGTLSTQNVTVTAVAHTLHFTGTGTITLTGTSTAGPLVGTGTGEENRVSLTFTPTAGTLTLTVSGTVTNADLTIGTTVMSHIPTAASTVTRTIDDVSMTNTSGIELTDNGNFSTLDYTGYTVAANVTASAATGTSVSTASSGTDRVVKQEYTVVIGRTYRAAFLASISAGNGARIRGTNSTSNDTPGADYFDNIPTTTPTTFTYDFVATATTIFIALLNDGGGVNATSLDDVTLQEVVPFVGYNQDEGTIVVIGTTRTRNVDGRFFSFSDGTTNELIASASNSNAHLWVKDGNTTQAQIDGGNVADDTQAKLAVAYKLNDFAVSIDGATAVTDGAGTLPAITELHMGADDDGTDKVLNGHIKSIVYYDVRLTDAQLERVSA